MFLSVLGLLHEAVNVERHFEVQVFSRNPPQSPCLLMSQQDKGPNLQSALHLLRSAENH